ncbi:MAG: DUF3784 domain-containing protein [Eubacteriales bacterium]
MWLGVLLIVAVGGLCIWLGHLIKTRQKIGLIHDYHHRNVEKEDVPAYCGEMGKAMYIIGGTIVASGLAALFAPEWVMNMLLVAGLAVALVVIHKAQMRYNGGWFS